MKALFEKATKMEATEIKGPEGSIHQIICIHLFSGQDNDQFGIFWAFLVQSWLGIDTVQGKCLGKLNTAMAAPCWAER